MLVLTRKLGEEFQIGESIRVKVLGLGSSKVRLGVAAPAKVKILRTELIGRETAATGGTPAAEARDGN